MLIACPCCHGSVREMLPACPCCHGSVREMLPARACCLIGMQSRTRCLCRCVHPPTMSAVRMSGSTQMQSPDALCTAILARFIPDPSWHGKIERAMWSCPVCGWMCVHVCVDVSACRCVCTCMFVHAQGHLSMHTEGRVHDTFSGCTCTSFCGTDSVMAAFLCIVLHCNFRAG